MPNQTSAKGLGAFVPLDYDTNNGGRWEHAIVMLPQTWTSMYDLIYAPETFAENFRGGYGSTPNHYHYGLQKRNWGFRDPITVRIEPLTVPSPANAAMLRSLANLYPEFAVIANEWGATTPRDFLAKILDALSHYPDGETAAVDSMPARSEPGKRPGSKIRNWQLQGDTSAVQPKYRFQYVAEYAIRTRTLSIYYIPRAAPLPNHRFSSVYSLTTTTVTPVLNTAATFMHVDVDFGTSKTPHSQADARARLATEFIIDPGFMNSATRPASPVPQFLRATAPFLPNHTLTTLAAPAGANHPFVQVRGQAIQIGGVDYHQPRLLLDSVWPTVPQAFGENTPNNPLCCLYEGELVEVPPGSGVWWFVTDNGLVKAYETGPAMPVADKDDETPIDG